MIRGIAIMGLNGCGKSTLAHAIGKKLDFYEMDVEDYYFPEQKHSRQAVLEHQHDVKCEYKGALPYSVPRSKKEVQDMILDDIKKHPQFIISGVTMNWEESILSVIDVAFILEVPTNERVKRVRQREKIRFGSRVMLGGDMYEQQKEFRDIIANKSNQSVEESANKIQCKKIKLDGTKSIDENVSIVLRILEEMDYLNY
uniref:AAA family ATPase n=1 Tax=Acetatifactor sp. TaxID=1872090 RepID=UPI004057A60B